MGGAFPLLVRIRSLIGVAIALVRGQSFGQPLIGSVR